MTTPNTYEGPLAGIKVIDFGHYYAGPMAGILLADQGASVLRIVKPSVAPELSEPRFRLLNRNKQILELDLKSPDGKAAALDLMKSADVVIENFRPGVMGRLGLDYASVKSINPRLIYLSLPGFASTDKERSHIQAWEGVLGAACGLYTDASIIRQLLSYPPVYSWVPLCSTYGATHGAIAIIAALHAREQYGRGTVIEIPLVEAGISAFGGSFLHAWKPDGFAPFRHIDDNGTQHTYEEWEEQKNNSFSSEDTPEEQSNKLAAAFRAFYSGPTTRFYQCADNRQVLLWMANFAKYGIALLKGLGIYSQLLEEGFVTGESTQGNSLTGLLNPHWQQRLIARISAAFLTRTADEWEEKLGNVTLIAKLRTRSEWLNLQPMLDSEVNVIMDNGYEPLTVPGCFANVTGPNRTPSNKYREPRNVSLAEAQLTLAPTASKNRVSRDGSPLKKGDLLADLKVLDLSNIVAGPTASYTLAQYGAEVIKVDPPNMTLGPYAPLMTLEIGQGKRSLLLDMTTAPGREVFRRLVCWADVVMHNFLDDVAERLGITHKQLQQINPRVVGCQISCFGGTYRGAWEQRPGLDPIPQAATGLMAHFGSLEEPQMHGRTACGDNMGALGLAFTALLAVWQQRQSGHAGEGRTSMAQANNFVQLPYMIAHNGHSDWGEDHGQLALGDRWYQRLFNCQDGWLFVSATEKQKNSLVEVVCEEDMKDIEKLEAAFAGCDCETWLYKLAGAGIAAHRVVSVTDIVNQGVRHVDNEAAHETSPGTGEIFCWPNHPSGQCLLMKAPDWVLIGEERSFKRLTPTPIFGQQSREILAEIGYTQEERDRLVTLGVVHEYQPVMGSKVAYLVPDSSNY